MNVRGKHTPGPWSVGTNGDGNARNHAICAGPFVIGKVYGKGYPIGYGWSPDSEADARFIVKTCNSHAGLIEALQAVLQHCVTVNGMPDKGKGRTDEQQSAYDAARAALAKAQGA